MPEQARTGKEPLLIGFQEIRCHEIFEVKMDFTRKARFVAGRHTTDTPGSITYSSVVSRDRFETGILKRWPERPQHSSRRCDQCIFKCMV